MSKLCVKRKNNFGVVVKEHLTILPRLFSHSLKPELIFLYQSSRYRVDRCVPLTIPAWNSTHVFNSKNIIPALRSFRQEPICKHKGTLAYKWVPGQLWLRSNVLSKSKQKKEKEEENKEPKWNKKNKTKQMNQDIPGQSSAMALSRLTIDFTLLTVKLLTKGWNVVITKMY